LISRSFNHGSRCGKSAIDSNADFFAGERFASLVVTGSGVNQGGVLMTMVSRLSVVTAYVAFAFVGAIVLGVIQP
jgi:hypothetical protein